MRTHGRRVRGAREGRHRRGRFREPGRTLGGTRDAPPHARHRRVSSIHDGRCRGRSRYNDVYLGSCAPGGYAWVFWKQPDVANVGIGVNLSRIKDRAEAKRYLDALISRTPTLAKGEIIEEVAGAVS